MQSTTLYLINFIISFIQQSTFSKTMEVLRSFIISIVIRRRYLFHLHNKSHVVTLTLLKAEGIIEEASAFSFGALPSIFITINSIGANKKCFQKIQSNTATMENLEWNQSHQVFMENKRSLICLNVMARQTLLGDYFIGQIVIDPFKFYSNKDSHIEFEIEEPITGTPKLPIFNDVGEKNLTEPTPRVDRGKLFLKLRFPSPLTNLCGWFVEISTNIFGIKETCPVWLVVTSDNNLNRIFTFYTSKYVGNVKRTFCLDELQTSTYKKEISYNISGMFEAGIFELTLTSLESFTFGWGEDSAKNKALWRSILCKSMT